MLLVACSSGLFESSSSFDECRLLIFLASVFAVSSLDDVLASVGASVDAGFVELDQSRQSCEY